jgi:hypothetical protein
MLLVNPSQENLNYFNVVWDARFSIFSSLVIAGFTNVFLSEIRRHKGLKIQFDLYSKTEVTFLEVITEAYLGSGHHGSTYWEMFLTKEKLAQALNSIREIQKTDGFIKIDPDSLYNRLLRADILLNEISRQYYSGQLEGCPIVGYSYGYEDVLHDAMISQQKLRILFKGNNYSTIFKEIPHLADLYHNVLVLLRIPWRLDFDVDQKIREKHGEKW